VSEKQVGISFAWRSLNRGKDEREEEERWSGKGSIGVFNRSPKKEIENIGNKSWGKCVPTGEKKV